MAERTKANAGANEDADISKIVDGINARNECGQKIIETAQRMLNIMIVGARRRTGSSRGTHHDFEVLVQITPRLTVWRKIEHKGGKTIMPIKEGEKPWAAGIQFYNGGCEKFAFTKIYAKLWYDKLIASEVLKNKFNIKAPIPTFEDWFALDCKTQGEPKTAFGKEMKAVYRSYDKRPVLEEERREIVDTFSVTEENTRELMAEVLTIANGVLKEKEMWLTIRGNLDGDFNCAWYPNFTLSKINSVTLQKGLDIRFEFHCEGLDPFHGHLRWGSSQGISNLRMDLK